MMHSGSMKLMRYFRDKYMEPGMTVLDIGSRRVHRSHNTYRRLFNPPYEYTGMDIVPGMNVDVVGYDALCGRRFDVVISGQTIEHIIWPWQWIRLAKQYFTKYICIIAPTASKEHRFPVDTFRYFPDGMRALFAWADIFEVEIKRVDTDTIAIGTKHDYSQV